MWALYVWTILRIPVGASGEGQYLCECLFGHGGTLLTGIRCCLIVPEWMGMIKTEIVGTEYGWEIGGAGVYDDICIGNRFG